MRVARVRDHEQAIASFEHTRKAKSVPLKDKRTTHYGNTIRKHREALGMDQRSVGEALGYSTNTISNWENGVSRPDIDAVTGLCALLQIPLPVFFALEQDPAVPEAEQALMRDYRSLSEDHRETVRQLTHRLAETDRAVRRSMEQLKNCVVLPVRALSAAAGTGVPADAEDTRESAFVTDNRLSRQAHSICRVNGDSMEPRFHDGDQVYVQNAESLAYGEVGIFLVNGALYIKEYRKNGLYSSNRAYRMMKITADDDVRMVGRVLGRVEEQDLFRLEV